MRLCCLLPKKCVPCLPFLLLESASFFPLLRCRRGREMLGLPLSKNNKVSHPHTASANFYWNQQVALKKKCQLHRANYNKACCDFMCSMCVLFVSCVTMERLQSPSSPSLYKTSKEKTCLPFLSTLLGTRSNRTCPAPFG